MFRLFFTIAFFILVGIKSAHADMPLTLVDVTLSGTMVNPTLEITQSSLKEGENYIFVIENTNDFVCTLQFDILGQAVNTQYLQGATTVSQDSVAVLGKSKVTWQFLAHQAGEYPLGVNTAAFNQSSNIIRLSIQKINPDNSAQASEEKALQTTESKKASKSKKKRRLL